MGEQDALAGKEDRQKVNDLCGIQEVVTEDMAILQAI